MDSAIHLPTTGTRLRMFGASVNITIKHFPTKGLKNGIHHFTKEMYTLAQYTKLENQTHVNANGNSTDHFKIIQQIIR